MFNSPVNGYNFPMNRVSTDTSRARPQIILGVCNAPDSGAALLAHGRILAAANEERFTREKLTATFPEQSIAYVLESNGLRPADVDAVGCGAWRGMAPHTLARLAAQAADQERRSPGAWALCAERACASASRDAARRAALIYGLVRLGFDQKKIRFCDHHESHALTAFCCSPFESALVLTADGRGDGRSVTLWQADRTAGLRLMDFETELASPGAFYGQVTKHLGFTPFHHEGKVTGLAALGRPTRAYDVLKKGFFFDEATETIQCRIGDYFRPFLTATPPRLARELEEFSREDVAWAAQKILEETLCGFLMRHERGRPAQSVDLCLAGGCMANVKLNMELARLAPVRNIYVFPHMGDGGNALGGALHAAAGRDAPGPCDLPTAYLGSEYPDSEIRAELERQGVAFRQLAPGEKSACAAAHAAAGRIVGWFQGRMEYGPRALGARTILAPATDPRITSILNRRLERSEFMPFAPAVCADLASRCFVGWRPGHVASRFMTVCYECTPYLAEQCPAVVHADGTARPQVVFRDHNPEYYDTLAAYHRLTGAPALINTSFNRHEEPIVNTPEQAVHTFRERWIDVLIIGGFEVRART